MVLCAASREPPMNELPRQKLCELIAEHGESLCDEPLRCEERLRDLCPNNPGEVNVLVDALRVGVATQLRSGSPVPIELRLLRLTPVNATQMLRNRSLLQLGCSFY